MAGKGDSAAQSEVSWGARVDAVVDALTALVSDLDADRLSCEDAERLTTAFARVERLSGAGLAQVARRAAECQAWRRAGERSPTDWLSRITGSSPGLARATLASADRARNQPQVADAWRAGQLSTTQVDHITAAAEVDPARAGDLVRRAGIDGINGLRDRCQAVRAAATSAADERARYRALHARRYLRTWTDADGAGRLEGRLTPDALGQLNACLQPFRERAFADARAAGRRDSPAAYQADALVDMARAATGHSAPAEPGSPPASVIIRVDANALQRGHTKPGETCEIDGVGPIPVAAARAATSDAFLAVVATRGIDVRSVTHLGRTPTAHQRTALVVRDPECVVPGCHATSRLEIDHVTPWALTHRTRLDDLARLCHRHHFLKTYEGWRLTGRPGQWCWQPPDAGKAEHGPDPPGPATDSQTESLNKNGAGAKARAPTAPSDAPTVAHTEVDPTLFTLDF